MYHTMTHACIDTCIYIYIYRERERARASFHITKAVRRLRGLGDLACGTRVVRGQTEYPHDLGGQPCSAAPRLDEWPSCGGATLDYLEASKAASHGKT